MNPRIYHESDVVVFFDGEHTASEVWLGDEIRNNHIRYFGVDIIVIWEYDIKHNFEDIKLMLTEKLT